MKTKLLLLAAILTFSFGFSQKKWTLKECVDYALKNNITVKQNLYNIDLAKEDKEISKGNFLGFNFRFEQEDIFKIAKGDRQSRYQFFGANWGWYRQF